MAFPPVNGAEIWVYLKDQDGDIHRHFMPVKDAEMLIDALREMLDIGGRVTSGSIHNNPCIPPGYRAVEYHPDGKVKKVEWAPAVEVPSNDTECKIALAKLTQATKGPGISPRPRKVSKWDCNRED